MGATATGKSALAIAVAERLDGEVISADAFAAYRRFDVGTAKPTPAERRGIPHHLIDVKDPTEPYSAGEFATRARAIAEEVLGRRRLPILCGGTGFYVRAFFDGLFDGPKRDARLRRALAHLAAVRGTAFLARALRLLDPASAARVAPNDTSRLVRFLEIALTTGRPASELFASSPGARWERPAVKLLLALPRPVLYGRISARFSRSFLGELPEEVQRITASGVPLDAPAFAAIGYRDTAEYVSGRLGRQEWEDRILLFTRRFAKRQETWFRKEPGVVTLEADRSDLIDLAVAHARPLFFDEGGPS
jgi:tRNA dimethylallyltransferase